VDINDRIGLIAEGVPLLLDHMTIRTTDTGKLLVTGWTNTIYFENVSRDKVLLELSDLKSSYFELADRYTDLNDIVRDNNLALEFHMMYGDSGKVAIGLCSEINGTVNWYIG
jgi:hypothetical protein